MKKILKLFLFSSVFLIINSNVNGLAVEDSLQNFNYINTGSSSNISVANGNMVLTSDLLIGDGRDGDLTLASSLSLDQTSLGASSDQNGTNADGYALKVTQNPTTTNIYVGSYNPSGKFVIGDYVILINLQGAYNDYADVGNYEIFQVNGVGGTSPNYYITINNTPTKSYDGTTFSSQKIVVQRVPQYNNVTINSGGKITARAWDGLTTLPNGNSGYITGMIIFMVKNSLIVNSGGSVNANAIGYRPGVDKITSQNGESYDGINGYGAKGGACTPISDLINGSGTLGGAGSSFQGSCISGYTAFHNNPGTRGGGGGGGIYGSSQTGSGRAGGGGAGGGYGGGGGGGGGPSGYCGYISGAGGSGGNTGIVAGGGAGSAYCKVGYNGGNAGSNGNGEYGGGAKATALQYTGSGFAPGGGGGGGIYGVENLSKIYLGSGGGFGGYGDHYNCYNYSSGSSGGGIIYIVANQITNNGTISNQGNPATNPSSCKDGGGGGGSGGSIYIKASQVSLGNTTADVSVKSSGVNQAAGGGGGGVGRIAVYSGNITGTTTPTAYTSGIPLNNSGTVFSNNILSGINATTISIFQINLSSLPANTGLSIQFSQDGTSWVNASGILGQSNALALNENSFDLTTLGWSGGNFYYKLNFTSDGSSTPIINSIILEYSIGHTIGGAPPNYIIVLAEDENIDVSTTGVSGVNDVLIKNSSNSNKIAEVAIDFSEDINFDSIVLDTGVTSSVFHVPGGITALPGYDTASNLGFTLYVPKGEGDKVWICPGASSLSSVSLSCSGGYFLTEGQTANGATATVEGIYWKVSGLTGTGGMSVITGLRDTLSRLKVGNVSDHTITFGTNYGLIAGSTDTMVLEFPDFDLSSLAITDIELTDNVGVTRTLAGSAGADTWGVLINTGSKTITFSVPTIGTGGYAAATQIVVKIGLNVTGGVNQITNPSSTGSFKEIITLNNTAPGEMGELDIPIVDSDTIDITGYVTAYIHFDIDTNTDNTDCAYDVCPVHGGIGAAEGDNYTVDLGELTSALVNKSNSISVVHSDTINGKINSIYFDLTSNAPGGVVVSVKSLNSGLKGPGTNMINSVTDGQDIPANSGLYGYNLTTGTTQKNGTVFPNISCDTSVEYCGPVSTPKTVFDTNNLPIDSARVRMDLAAAAAYTNNPGVYTDTLTFVATGTF
jgi:hypothetical protein